MINNISFASYGGMLGGNYNITLKYQNNYQMIVQEKRDFDAETVTRRYAYLNIDNLLKIINEYDLLNASETNGIVPIIMDAATKKLIIGTMDKEVEIVSDKAYEQNVKEGMNLLISALIEMDYERHE